MSIHDQRINGRNEMNAHSDVTTAQAFAARLEGIEAGRGKFPLADIRKRVARKVSSSPGFFENLQRGRIKSVPSWLMRKLRDALVEELQTEVHKLQHEIHIYRQTGEGPDSDALFEAQTRLAEAKKIFGVVMAERTNLSAVRKSDAVRAGKNSGRVRKGYGYRAQLGLGPDDITNVPESVARDRAARLNAPYRSLADAILGCPPKGFSAPDRKVGA